MSQRLRRLRHRAGLPATAPLRDPRRYFSLPCWLLAGFFLLGCEVVEPVPPAPRGPRLYPVHGTVTVDGKPLATPSSFFCRLFPSVLTVSARQRPTERTNWPTRVGPVLARATIGSSLATSSRTMEQWPASHLANDPVPPITRGKELIPPRYNDFSKTELRAIVKPGCPPIDFDLKGPLLGEPVSALDGPTGPTPTAPEEG